jgi:hypothetical protein
MMAIISELFRNPLLAGAKRFETVLFIFYFIQSVETNHVKDVTGWRGNGAPKRTVCTSCTVQYLPPRFPHARARIHDRPNPAYGALRTVHTVGKGGLTNSKLPGTVGYG